jgi:hypothetical protein
MCLERAGRAMSIDRRIISLGCWAESWASCSSEGWSGKKGEVLFFTSIHGESWIFGLASWLLCILFSTLVNDTIRLS